MGHYASPVFRIGPGTPRPLPKHLLARGHPSERVAAVLAAGVTPENFARYVLGMGVDPGSVADELKDTEAARTYPRLRHLKPVPLEDGTLGFFVRWPRKDDCQAAAIATVLQVPIGKVPDPRIDERLEAGEDDEEIDRRAHVELTRWLARRGLRMVVHRSPLDVARRRWIGVVMMPGRFQNHCLVMDRQKCLFDPVRHDYVMDFPGRQLRRFRVEDVSYGLSFQAAKRKT
jgi:hypothetical protein